MTAPADPNPGRRLAYETFRDTLHDLFGRSGVSESDFREHWLARLRKQQDLTTNGWYDPPPCGIGVLFGSDDSAEPFSCASLRPPERWPADRIIPWSRGLMYAYCSPVHLPTRLPADFGVTLYFGSQPNIKAHFARALSLAREVLAAITPDITSRSLFQLSQHVFGSAGMGSNVASITDSVPVDLGHSLPRVPADLLSEGRELTAAAKEAVRSGRLFLSESADWPIARAGQFTIEPSLVSRSDARLPQVSPHYVVDASNGVVTVQRECELVLAEFGLT